MQNNNELIEKTIALAEKWQERANELLTKEEKKMQDQMACLLNNPQDKVTLINLVDQSFRPKNTKRVANQVVFTLDNNGIPTFFSSSEKKMMQFFKIAGKYFHQLAIPTMVKQIRAYSSRSILYGEEEALLEHLAKRKRDNVRMNINHIGEAVLGEEEAEHRILSYIADLENPEIECISIKISTIYSQISSLGFEHTVNVLIEKLSRIYDVAQKNFFVRQDGTKAPKSVNLDMEEYRDLAITKEAFIRTLEKEEFKNYLAGIVLQAYVPDSFEIQKELTEWSKNRVQNGGAPIKIRIVKGANMEMEQLEASLMNWPLAPYDNKLEVDANYKRMVDYGMQKENITAVNLGIASHNLFELSYAFNVAKENDSIDFFVFEMLEGMADHIRRAIKETVPDMLLYAPVATFEQFINAIAYLVRRLDENTEEENFLRYSCDLTTDSKEWEFLKQQFINAVNFKDKAKNSPNRIQNRNTETFDKKGTLNNYTFVNESDTDFSILNNVEWAENIKKQWKREEGSEIIDIPVVIGGNELKTNREKNKIVDLSQIDKSKNFEIHIADSYMANIDDIDTAIKTAVSDSDGWRAKTPKERHAVLSKAAENIRKSRGDLIGATIASTGKVLTEADVEVSEAIDFTEFYPFSVNNFEEYKNLKTKGKGVGLVITPWNFPIAIPCGGMVAALAAGNTVIFKPASNATLTAYILCKCFWDAGISKKTLQFVPCQGSTVGAELVKRDEIDFVILTGGTDTGLRILNDKPNTFLSAETGGKNATIITSMADKDQAMKNVIHSAFGNCGQKCSATSLLVLEEEIYNDENFKKQLVDATKSYKVGSAWDYENKMGTMTNIPSGDLKNVIENIDEGEEWALEPQNLNNNPYLWTPGIKYGVKKGSYSHMTEFFGPILSVMKVKNLTEAIDVVNYTGYGLTSGIETLDIREQEIWKEKIKAGNLYINRGTTGAIVLRQPFGGMGKSAIGAGIKAGSPNYVSLFMDFEENNEPTTGVIKKETKALRAAQEWQIKLNWGGFADNLREDIQKTINAIKSYTYNAEKEFLVEHDYFNLRGQDNIFRYLPLSDIVIRISEKDSLFEILARIAGAKAAGVEPTISIPESLDNEAITFIKGTDAKKLIGHSKIVYESDEKLAERIDKITRIRYAAPDRVPETILKKAAESDGFYIARGKVFQEGRVELLNYFREQSVCSNYHRYGNLGQRGITLK